MRRRGRRLYQYDVFWANLFGPLPEQHERNRAVFPPNATPILRGRALVNKAQEVPRMLAKDVNFSLVERLDHREHCDMHVLDWTSHQPLLPTKRNLAVVDEGEKIAKQPRHVIRLGIPQQQRNQGKALLLRCQAMDSAS
jgi:hypothetical protein